MRRAWLLATVVAVWCAAVEVAPAARVARTSRGPMASDATDRIVIDTRTSTRVKPAFS